MSTIKVNALRHTGGSSDNINLDSSARVLIGTSSSAGANRKLQIAGTDANGASMSICRNTNNNDGVTIDYIKSRNGTYGSSTVVQSGDLIGKIQFRADDGTDYASQAAAIEAAVDGTPGSNDMPGRLVFSTTADGASSPTEAMRIDSSQNLRFNSGFGSVGTAYGVRAWIHFNGTGTVVTNDHGNISGLTDEGTGEYTISFTNAMPDGNYATAGSAKYQSATNRHVFCAGGSSGQDPATGSLRFQTVYIDNNVPQDCEQVTVIVVR